jgi:hypothetical protein
MDCPMCKQIHEIPQNGFMKNQALAKLATVKPKEISRGTIFQDLKSSMQKIEQECQSLDANLVAGQNRIREYCRGVRSDVSSAIEKWRENLNKFQTEFDEKIDSYENLCLNNYVDLGEEKTAYEKSINQAKEMCKEWTEYLKSTAPDDSIMEKASRAAKPILSELHSITEELRYRTFNGKLLKNVVSQTKIQPGLITKVFVENIKEPTKEVDGDGEKMSKETSKRSNSGDIKILSNKRPRRSIVFNDSFAE